MSNKPHHEIQGRDDELKAIVVSFMPNGTDDPATANNRGAALYNVTHEDTGEWEVTLDDTYPHVIGITYGIERATPAAAAVDIHTIANTIHTDGKLSLVYREDHVAANIAANTSTRITVTIWARNRAPRG